MVIIIEIIDSMLHSFWIPRMASYMLLNGTYISTRFPPILCKAFLNESHEPVSGYHFLLFLIRVNCFKVPLISLNYSCIVEFNIFICEIFGQQAAVVKRIEMFNHRDEVLYSRCEVKDGWSLKDLRRLGLIRKEIMF